MEKSVEQHKGSSWLRSWRTHDVLSKANYVLVGNYEFDQQTKRYLALTFLLLAVIIGFGSYTQSGLFRSSSINFRPELYSGMLAIGFVAAFHARRLIPVSLSIYFLLSFSLNVSVTAIIIQGLLGKGLIFGFAMKTAIPAALVMTWFGIRAIAPIIWLLVIILGSWNLSTMGNAMGLWGFGFLLLSTLGILLQIEGKLAGIKDEIIQDITGRYPSRRVEETYRIESGNDQ